MAPTDIGPDDGRVEPLGESSAEELTRLFEACADYVLLSEARAPSSAQAHELFRELPAGRAAADKHVLGLRGADGRLAGVVDVVRDYPAAREWFLGLLLLLPSARGRGLGERAYRAVEAWARAQGAVAIWLAVLDQNPRARRFWERLGFSAVDRRRVRNGGLESDAVRMVRRLDGSV